MVSMVCTLANYGQIIHISLVPLLTYIQTEYIWNYYFYQDGNIELEIRLSGILQVYAAGPNEPDPHGVVVAPGVNAHVHQHIFSVRVDPMLDGIRNSVIESDIVSLDAPTGSKENFAGNGFGVKERVLKDQVEDGARDFDWAAERRWKVANLNKTHYASGKPSSYQIMMKGGLLPLLSKSDSWIARRASFAHKPLWVVKDVEGAKGGRMWPSGKYVPQTREEPKDSVGRWVREGQGSIHNEDIVLYLTVGACVPPLASHRTPYFERSQARHTSHVRKTGQCQYSIHVYVHASCSPLTSQYARRAPQHRLQAHQLFRQEPEHGRSRHQGRVQHACVHQWVSPEQHQQHEFANLLRALRT